MTDLEQLRTTLLAKRAELAERRDNASQHARRASGPLNPDFAEQAVERQNDDVIARIGESATVEIAAIDRALNRIDQGLYGICARCGEEIDPRRLAARPYADLCLHCSE
ncbi:MAG TPA: TraR/DksA family transcriptional regulator [Steroidobacteraceae bacterium]|nr:TraR/DksA family transcriptional regulator [Steroidobacteraceae bacterium]